MTRAVARAVTRREQRAAPSKGDLREQALLAAGRTMLTQARFEAASVSDLAAEAGISRATFYFYFASKQDLLSAVIAAAVSELEASLAEPAGAGSRPGSLAETVAATVRAAGDLWWHHREVLVASVELGAALPDVYDRNLESIERVSRATLALLDRSDEATRAVVRALVLMTERNLYDLARQRPTRAEHDALVKVLTTVWLRSLHLDD